jgi:hypothetical protein
MVSETEGRGGPPGLADAAACAALLSVTLALSAPAAIYFGNHTEFIDAFVELLPWLLLAGATLFGGLTAGLMALRQHAGGAAAAVTVLSLALWIQSNLILQSPRVLAGTVIDWSQYVWQGWADRALWGVAILLALAAMRRGWRWPPSVLLALCAIQVGAVLLQAASSPPRWVDRTTFDESQRYALSTRQNVIVLVLDTFQSDLFQELLDDQPGIREALPGFTYFRNATAGFPSTAPSIPFILTGRQYDNATPFDQFVRDAFVDGSLPQVLKATGHHVYYNSAYLWPAMYADERTSSHASSAGTMPYTLAPWARASMLLVLGAFRSAPQDVKQLVERPVVEIATRGAVAWGDDRTFFDEFERETRASLDVPAFKYYHLQGLHPPLRYDAALRSANRPFVRANALDQARGLVSMLRRMVAALRSRGLYDSTALFVLADHGASLEPRLVNVEARSRSVAGATPLATAHTFGLPLLLAKPFDGRAALVASDTPVSIGDLGATVGDTLGLAAEFPGMSVFEQAQAPRPRRVLRYDPDRLNLNQPRFPPLTEYLVSGFSWLGESWTPTGRVLTTDGVTTRAAPALATGPITFGTSGNAIAAQQEGWSPPEDGFTWTNGWTSGLTLSVPACAGTLTLEVRVMPALLGGRTQQRVEVLEGDRIAGVWQVAAAGAFEVPLTSAPVERLAKIRFLLPDAVVPADVKPEFGDTRRLGLAFSSLRAICNRGP